MADRGMAESIVFVPFRECGRCKYYKPVYIPNGEYEGKTICHYTNICKNIIELKEGKHESKDHI